MQTYPIEKWEIENYPEGELEEIRQKRAKERVEISAKRAAVQQEAVKKTPAAVQKSMVDKMIENLNWIHKRH